MASEYLIDGYVGVSSEFTNFEELPSHGHHRLTRVKRYGRWYLLKSLTAEASDKLFYQEALCKELDILMRLQHPGIVQTSGMETVDGFGPCIVMEWIDGITLDQWLAGHPSLMERRQAFEQLLDAVGYIHSLGIVHRDLKPENIMIATTGHHVKLIDFSLADTDVHAVLKQPAGTREYMSPEQVSTNVPDIRNDIYSLGIVMQQMDFGSPFPTVAARCLRPIVERYQTIDALHRDLSQRLQRGQWLRRCAIVLLVVAMLAGLLWLVRPLMPIDSSSPLVDSLRTQLEANIETVRQNDSARRHLEAQLSVMQDSLSLMRGDNASLQQQQSERDARQ